MPNIEIFPKSHKHGTLAVIVGILGVAGTHSAISEPEGNGRGSRPISLANAYVAIADDPWGTCYNPAGLASIPYFRGMAFFSPAPFDLKELRTACIGVAVPITVGGLGIVVEQFGFDLYRENNLAAGFGGALNESVSLGATVNIQRVAITHYGNSTSCVFDFGAMASITDDVRIGWCWSNVTQATIGMKPEQIPQTMSLGVCYEVTDHSRITLELEKELQFPIVKKFGFEQILFDVISFRCGVSDNPDKFSCGLGVRAAGFEFSYAGYSHPQLGWTHQVELSFALSR